MLDLISNLIKRIKAIISLRRMTYEMKQSYLCLDLINTAMLADSVYDYEAEISDLLFNLERRGISLVSDLNIMFNCLLFLEDLSSVTVDGHINWASVVKTVAYINTEVRLLSIAVAQGARVRRECRLSGSQIKYLNRYSDIVHHLVVKTKAIAQ